MREDGSAPLELAIGVLVLLVPAALLVLSFGPWLERRAFVRTAAAEIARFVILSNGDEAAALDALETLAVDNGLEPSSVSVGLCGPAAPLAGDIPTTCIGSGLVRGGRVEVTVAVDVPAIVTPFGTVGSVTSGYTHAELVDVYRSLP